MPYLFEKLDDGWSRVAKDHIEPVEDFYQGLAERGLGDAASTLRVLLGRVEKYNATYFQADLDGIEWGEPDFTTIERDAEGRLRPTVSLNELMQLASRVQQLEGQITTGPPVVGNNGRTGGSVVRRLEAKVEGLVNRAETFDAAITNLGSTEDQLGTLQNMVALDHQGVEKHEGRLSQLEQRLSVLEGQLGTGSTGMERDQFEALQARVGSLEGWWGGGPSGGVDEEQLAVLHARIDAMQAELVEPMEATMLESVEMLGEGPEVSDLSKQIGDYSFRMDALEKVLDGHVRQRANQGEELQKQLAQMTTAHERLTKRFENQQRRVRKLERRLEEMDAAAQTAPPGAVPSVEIDATQTGASMLEAAKMEAREIRARIDDRVDEFPRRLIGLVNDLAREGGLEFESYAPALADWVEQRRATLLQEPIPTESDGLAAVFALTQYEKGLDQREPSPPVDLVIWIYRDLWREHECVPVNTATMAATLCEMAGVVPLIAEARAPVDSKLHDPVTAVEADGLPAGYVLRTKSPGFRLADGTLRTKARVVVSG